MLSSLGPDAVLALALYPVAFLTFRVLLPQGGNVLAVALLALAPLGDEVLQPLVLRLELVDAALQGLYLVAHPLRGLLESLLVLLLHAEAGGGSSIPATLGLLSNTAGGILVVVGCGRGFAFEAGLGGGLDRNRGRAHGGVGGVEVCVKQARQRMVGVVRLLWEVLEVELRGGEVICERHSLISN